MSTPAVLVLEDGSVFRGTALGRRGLAVGEVVFNTGMSGYQEILTDPSYLQQIVTLTYPHIGNTGINLEDNQSDKAHLAGLVIREQPLLMSHWQARLSLDEYLEEQGVVGIADLDTRALTTLLREHGSLRGCIRSGDDIDEAAALTAAKLFKGLGDAKLAPQVSTKSFYPFAKNNSKTAYTVVIIDCGVKRGILRQLENLGCTVYVVPFNTSLKAILALKPDGVVISNGPGDPAPLSEVIFIISQLINLKMPLFGICLGIQLLALALGGKTYKMKFGHHGTNHPVQDLETKCVLITSQNHGFAVDPESLGSDIIVTHRSLFDDSLQGFRHSKLPIFGFQGHPEAGPGPLEGLSLFEPFIQMMEQYREKN